MSPKELSRAVTLVKCSEDRNVSRDAQSQVYTPEVSDGLKCEL